MKFTKNRYLLCFTLVILVLFMVRLIFPSITHPRETSLKESIETAGGKVSDDAEADNPVGEESKRTSVIENSNRQNADLYPIKETTQLSSSTFFDSEGNVLKHKVKGVPRYADAFPDSQQVQLESALKWGVTAVVDRVDAESRKKELVYVGASPFFHVEQLTFSVPYLVPRAAVLLNDIGRAYFDSLQLKGMPLHQLIVTSVLRTRNDVDKLRKRNRNATDNSCHLYGTTFDISYRRYRCVDALSKNEELSNSEPLKHVLSEVLNDMRLNNRCYVKHEVKQGCFHITVR